MQTTLETGQAGQAMPDEAVLTFACTKGRALLTLNRKHFIRLHLQDNKHCGIIACTFDPDFLGLANRIHEALNGSASLSGQLIRINRPRR